MVTGNSEIVERIGVLRADVVKAYESYLGMPPSDKLSDEQIATEVRVYSRRNSDAVVEEKCSELLKLINQKDVEDLIFS